MHHVLLDNTDLHHELHHVLHHIHHGLLDDTDFDLNHLIKFDEYT